MDELNNYKNEGFKGFVKISDLRMSTDVLPRDKGVYVVIRKNDEKPKFLECGTGGHFKGKDPNVSISELENNLVSGSNVMYIGKATNLRNRLKQLLRFGAGANVGHWGGRYLWQLSDANDLIIAWKETPMEDPRTVEIRMLTEYVNKYGKRPFANLAD